MFLGVRALLRCPKFFYVLERRKILTATPFYTHCIRHRRRSYKMPVTNLSTTPNLINNLKQYGGEEGIRTLVGLPPNGFQDRLVMTTSIPLRMDLTILS